MIEITPTILRDYPNAFRKARNERIRAVRLESDLWYCARRESGHGQYLIKFHVFPTVRGGEQVKAECRSVQGQRCKGDSINSWVVVSAKCKRLGYEDSILN